MAVDIRKMPDECPVCGGTGKFQGDIASKVAWLRSQTGLKQQELADIADVSRTTIANIETGRQAVTGDTLIRIARHFKVTTDWLLGV